MKTLKWIAGAALALTSIAAQAQQWPQKPMIFLNPFPAGGGTDTFARPIAAKLSQQLGEQALIENQGGAGGRTRRRRCPATGTRLASRRGRWNGGRASRSTG